MTYKVPYITVKTIFTQESNMTYKVPYITVKTIFTV